MINPVTGWFEMAQIQNKTAAKVADIAEKRGSLDTHYLKEPL
jgi:hypothetical protein